MLVKVIFTNIHKMSNECADSFDRYLEWFIIYCTMYEKTIVQPPPFNFLWQILALCF